MNFCLGCIVKNAITVSTGKLYYWFIINRFFLICEWYYAFGPFFLITKRFLAPLKAVFRAPIPSRWIIYKSLLFINFDSTPRFYISPSLLTRCHFSLFVVEWKYAFLSTFRVTSMRIYQNLKSCVVNRAIGQLNRYGYKSRMCRTYLLLRWR